ncbi:hypothetical protein [Arsukibacterium sp.]|uniref:hypothetical protein n=1 Tax=Arsukibacterium sp. TaxID=1977258 RepID=UPI002FD8CC9C
MKYLAYAAAAAAIITALYQAHSYIFEQGRITERAEIQRAYNAAMEKQQAKYRDLVQHALNAQAQDHASEIQRIAANQQTETITKEIIRYVDRKIIVPAECDQLAADVVSVLQQTSAAIRAANRTAESGDQPGAFNLLPTDSSDPGRATRSAEDAGGEFRSDSRLLSPPSKPG